MLRRIEAVDATLGAYWALRAEAALEEARAVDERRARGEAPGPLAGLPLAVKDNTDVAGMRATSGSPLFAERVAAEDAEVVRRLRTAGAIVIGKTALHELAYGVITDNPHFGRTRNPWEPARTAGGSSGGSGAAVAADAALLALGTDTGGSVRIPAALDGVSGLRPTHGAVSVRGILPLSPSLDTAGPLARWVRDLAPMLAAMAGFDPEDPWAADGRLDPAPDADAAGARGLRIRLVEEGFEGVEAALATRCEAAATVFGDLGADVAVISLPGFRDAVRTTNAIMRSEALALHEEQLDADPSAFGADVRQRLALGREVTGARLARALGEARSWRAQVRRAFDGADVLLMPTTGAPAPRLDGLDITEATAQLIRLTYPWSLAGVPALSVPCGLDGDGLPVGLQLVAAPWRDAVALRAGAAFQAATDHHRRRPALVDGLP